MSEWTLFGFPVVEMPASEVPATIEEVRLGPITPGYLAGLAEARARGEIPFVEGDPLATVAWDYVATLGRWPFRGDA